MSYLVKALGACKAPVKPDVDAVWAADEIREVDDSLYSYYRNRSAAFTILAGPGAAANLSAALTAAEIPVGGGAETFQDLTDTPPYLGKAGLLHCVNLAEDALEYTSDADCNVYLQSSANNDVTLDAQGTGSVFLTAGSHVEIGASEDIKLALDGNLTINNVPAIETQSVLVAGVGTLEFTHGILTGFTPA